MAVTCGLQISKLRKINRNVTRTRKTYRYPTFIIFITHVPVSLDDETLEQSIEEGLSFATEKLDELDALRRLFNQNDSAKYDKLKARYERFQSQSFKNLEYDFDSVPTSRKSYGSRAVKPPVIYGDVKWTEPLTVKETVYAQSLTDKPVKGMLTGPVTILNWSFERVDVPRKVVQDQIALAIDEEVLALEEAGIKVIQVDEPALREGLPLRSEYHEQYLADAVNSFKLATSSVQDETQIHTHMCYSQFGQIIHAIHELDADVISIETSRSHGDLIKDFEDINYDLGIGLGVYDIHSPRIPTEDEIATAIDRSLQQIDRSLFWVNPDCGLKHVKKMK